MWDVEFTDEFEEWWGTLNEDEQEDVDACVSLLIHQGPHLPYPYSSGINGSKHSHLRELRIQHKGQPYRVLYAFNPRRTAILLLGGNKVSNNRWYLEKIVIAEKLYDEHLEELKKEDKIK